MTCESSLPFNFKIYTACLKHRYELIVNSLKAHRVDESMAFISIKNSHGLRTEGKQLTLLIPNVGADLSITTGCVIDIGTVQ